MSRIANNPVELPAGVEIIINGHEISVKGSKGTLAMNVSEAVEVKQVDNILSFAAKNKSKDANALAGTTRALISNMVFGVTQGFERKFLMVLVTVQKL
jgi:large subunit ribosomal protein L6